MEIEIKRNKDGCRFLFFSTLGYYDIQPKRPTSNRDEPAQRDTGVTQSDWDKFAQDTNELERRRQVAESARLANEKARRDREERERAKQASRTIIDNDRDHGLEL